MSSNLFTPLTLRGTTFRNRIAVSPMCQYSSQDGFATDWHLVHLGSRAVGGAGLVLTEATAVSPEGRITPQDLGIWKDEHLDMLTRITTFITAQGAIPGIQLAHAGRKASHQPPWVERGAALPENHPDAWETVAPSAVAFKENEIAPHELTTTEIDKIITDFTTAAQRALKAGFVVAELHAAHGYLLHQFYSPISNKRTDEYGGSLENRCRLVVRIAKEVRAVWPQHQPLFVRISSTDWTPNGWTDNDSVQLATWLKEAGVDLIDCSSGGNVPKAPIPNTPLYQVPFAEKVRKESNIPTGAVGLITTAQEAEEIITTGQADLILLARELLRNPYFPIHAAKELGFDYPWPLQYERAKL